MAQISMASFGLRAFNANGYPVSGALCYVYEAGTTTPVTTFADKDLTTPQEFPVPANANGGFPEIYVPDGFYKVDLTDSASASLPGFPKDNLTLGFSPVAMLSYATRAQAVAAIASGALGLLAEGTTIIADGLTYQKMASSHPLYGTDPIPDMPGYAPVAPWRARHFGAALDDTTDDVDAIQTGINALHALFSASGVGGDLLIDGQAFVGETSETDTYLIGDMQTSQSVSGRVCLVIRDGVTIRFTAGARVRNSDPTLTVFLPLDIETSGGIVGDPAQWGEITSGWTATGTGHGIQLAVSAQDVKFGSWVADRLYIHDVGSYGIAHQFGFAQSLRCTNIWIKNTGADGIDNKNRGLVGDGQPQEFFDNILIEQHGQRSGITGSAGIDLRGGAVISNVIVRDFAKDGQGNVGMRFSSSVIGESDDEYRPPSNFSNISNVTIDGGDPSVLSQGMVWLSSKGTNASNVTIRNCREAVSFGDAASGVGDTCEGASLANLTAEGVWDIGVDINSAKVTVSNATVQGARDQFSEDRENLTPTQTLFTLPRKHRQSGLQVYKNGTLLTLTTDYTVTASGGIVTAITLVVAAIANDKIDVVTPLGVGYNIEKVGCDLIGCSTLDATDDLGGVEYPNIVGGSINRVRSWSPTISDAQSGGNLATADSAGRYKEIDGVAHLWGHMDNIDTSALSAGTAYVQGPPFASAAAAGARRYVGSVRARNVTFTGYIVVEMVDGNNFLTFHDVQSGAGGALLTKSSFAAGTADLDFEISYPVR